MTDKNVTATPLVLRAMKILHGGFEGKKDKMGNDATAHSYRVAHAAATYGRTTEEAEELFVTGLLHDVIEDTKFTYDDLVCDFPTSILDNVVILSHKEPREPYMDFIRGCLANRNTTIVKFCDVSDNLTRLKPKKYKYHEKLDAMVVLAAAMKEIVFPKSLTTPE